MNFRQLTRLVIDQNLDFLESNQVVVLGMSGGIDSTALFHVFCELRKLKKIKNFMVLHVNYGLRGSESEGDFVFCRDLAALHNVDFHCLNCLEQDPRFEKHRGESTQVWARRVRHAWFQEFNASGHVIALAHNANDVAENVLFRLARGAMPENLAGMSRLDGLLWRPLIAVLRVDIAEAMSSEGHAWREDSSNQSLTYVRNRIRHNVVIELESIAPGAARRIADFGAMLAEQHRLTDSHVRDELILALADKNLSRQKVHMVRDFLDTAKTGQSVDLGEGFALVRQYEQSEAPNLRPNSDLNQQSKARALQHAHGIDLDQVTAIMSGESSLFVAKPAIFAEIHRCDLMPIQIGGKKDQESAEIVVLPPKSDDRVTFAELTSPFKFKELMQKWKVGILDRLRFVVVKTTRTHEARLVKLFQSGKT